MKEALNAIEGAADAFGQLTRMRREHPETFDALAQELLESHSKNSGIWRYLSLYFIRSEQYAVAAVTANKHLSCSPNSQEAFLRRYRIALLAADSQTARRMLDEHTDRVSEFQYESSRFFYIQRFNHGLIPIKGEIERLKERTCIELNASLMKELRRNTQMSEPETNVHSATARRFWDSVENTKRFAQFIAKLDGIRKVIILGNGGSLRGSKLGQHIESQDFIIRINFPKIIDLEEDVGARTDLVFFTEAFLHSIDNVRSLSLLRSAYAGVPGLAIDAARTQRVEDLVMLEDHREGVALVPVEIREILRALSYEFATTGLCGLVLLFMLLRKEVELFGFDFYSPKTDLHFFSKAPTEVFIGHETAFERFLAELYS